MCYTNNYTYDAPRESKDQYKKHQVAPDVVNIIKSSRPAASVKRSISLLPQPSLTTSFV